MPKQDRLPSTRRAAVTRTTWIAVGTLAVLVTVSGYVWKRNHSGNHEPPTAASQLATEGDEGESARRLMVVTPNTKKQRDSLLEQLDPTNDGWKTEAISQRVSDRLRVITRLLTPADSIGEKDVDELVVDRFSCDPLRPTRLDTVYRDQAIVVRRDASREGLNSIGVGKARMAAALNELRTGFARTSHVRADFKTFRVNLSDESLTTTVLYTGSGRNAEGVIQQNATWQMRWVLESFDAHPRLESIRVQDFEEIQTSTDRELFADCTESVLGVNSSFRDQLRHGAGYWMQRLDRYLSPRLLEGHIGFAIGDVNDDGLEDLYVCQPGGLPNRLYVQNSDGSATDVSAGSGVDALDWSHSALLVDLDNDGHQDLAVLADGLLLIFSGDGTGRFRLRSKLSESLEYALSAADFDSDGDLDLFACNYFAESADGLAQLGRTDPLFDSNTGGRNVLFRNDGEWNFLDVTDEVGLDVNNRRWTLAAAWEDYDNDGDQDLYVVNDFGHNSLYRNDAGRFVEVAGRAGVIDANQGMSVTWGDYNLDGWMDVYVSNMFSAAGNRVTLQPNFLPGKSAETKGLYQQLAKGNTLLQNLGNGGFRDVSHATGVTMGRWAWASLFADINNDGREDLIVTNGYLTQESPDDL